MKSTFKTALLFLVISLFLSPALSAQQVSEGITGPAHEKYKNQLVFSTTRLTRENMNADVNQYKQTFNLGENIYGVLFMSEPITSYSADAGRILFTQSSQTQVHFFIDIDSVSVLKYGQLSRGPALNDKGKLTTTIMIPVLPQPGGTEAANVDLVQAINALAPGDHTVKLTVHAESSNGTMGKDPIATGSFTLHVGAGAKAKIGKSFESLPGGMKDPALEAKILLAAQKVAKSNNTGTIYSKVKIINHNWTIERTPYTGVVTDRTISAYILGKWKDGHCAYEYTSFKQEYEGGKFLDPLIYLGKDNDVPCDCSK